MLSKYLNDSPFQKNRKNNKIVKGHNDLGNSISGKDVAHPESNLIIDRNDCLDFGDYTSYVNLTMSKYDIEEDANYNTKDKEAIKILQRLKLDKSGDNKYISENSTIKVYAYKKKFNNPLESHNLLKKNRKIYNEISYNFKTRQESICKSAYDQIKKESIIFLKKIPNLKISECIPVKSKFDITENSFHPEHSIKHNYYKKRKNKLSSNLMDVILPSIKEGDEDKFFCFYKNTKLYPEGRELFSFNGDISTLFMWGGINSNKNNAVWTLELENLEWNKDKTPRLAPISRWGHTGILHYKRYFVFGGRAKDNNYTFIPQDLEIYNIEDKVWFSPTTNLKSVLSPRRNHIADVIGNYMLIHGGISENNEYLNDTAMLCFSPIRFYTCSISDMTPWPKLAGHACAMVVPSEIKYNPKFNLYKIDFHLMRIKQTIKEKGWYIFGGKYKEDHGLSNDLWVLRIGKKPLEWVKPETFGKPPTPRCFHTMNYYESGNIVVIHGGRNDYESESCALNDTFVLDLASLTWREIRLISHIDNFKVASRYGHSAQVYGNKLIIFGGMNSYNYIGSSLFIVELDILNSNMLNNVMHLKDYHIPQINDSQYFSNKLPLIR